MVDTVLGLALIGTAAAIHFRPRRHRPRIRHRVRTRPRRLHFRLRWLPAPLAFIGVVLIVTGWLRPDEADTEPTVSTIESLVPEQSPQVAGEGAGLVLVRGTPTDDDSATESEIQDYSTRLGTILAGALSRPPVALAVRAQAIDADQWSAVRNDQNSARQWCQQEGAPAFVAVIGMSAVRLENGAGYAPWREPEYLILSCTDDRQVTVRGRANERLGDRVPYEQSVADDLRVAIGRLGRQPD